MRSGQLGALTRRILNGEIAAGTIIVAEKIDRLSRQGYDALNEWMKSVTRAGARVEARKLAGMTQRDLAVRLKKPQSFVAKVEAIERNLSVLELLEWTDAIGIAPASVLVSDSEIET